jgi:hypothetical protein
VVRETADPEDDRKPLVSSDRTRFPVPDHERVVTTVDPGLAPEGSVFVLQKSFVVDGHTEGY